MQFGTGGQDNNDTDSGGTAFQEFETKIQSLETCLQQRNNEIAILVNMVKQGKEFEEKVPENNTPKRFEAVRVDPAVLDDPAKAFEAFSQQYPKNHASYYTYS